MQHLKQPPIARNSLGMVHLSFALSITRTYHLWFFFARKTVAVTGQLALNLPDHSIASSPGSLAHSRGGEREPGDGGEREPGDEATDHSCR